MEAETVMSHFFSIPNGCRIPLPREKFLPVERTVRLYGDADLVFDRFLSYDLFPQKC